MEKENFLKRLIRGFGGKAEPENSQTTNQSVQQNLRTTNQPTNRYSRT